MTSEAIELEGVNDVLRSLERFEHQANDLGATFQRTGDFVIDEAKQLTPIRSGALRASITGKRIAKGFVITAGAGLEYAGVVHYGWPAHGMESQPFLTSAVVQQERAIEQQFIADIEALIYGEGLR